MSKWLSTIFIITTIMLIGTSTAFAAGEDIKLMLDGTIIETDVPPLLESGRTLVPYRALLEAMGAEVSWDEQTKMAAASLGSYNVQVTIDSKTGFVNGAIKEMEVPPRTIDGRTVIPLRFVLENLNCSVSFDDISRTVLIESPELTGATQITEITLSETETTYRISARGNNIIEGTKTFAYEAPERFGIDIKNAAFPEGSGTIEASNDVFTAVRYAQFDETTVRVVVDLSDKTAGQVSLSDDRMTVYIDFEKKSESSNADSADDIDTSLLPELNWMAAGKLVVVDAGHGGKDPGAEGKLGSKHAIWEKEINLPVALRVEELLSAAGAKVQLVRSTDVFLTTYERAEVANTECASLFVSIHNNSNDYEGPNGTEVLYYNKTTESDHGITSQELATYIQVEMAAATGFKDRGVQKSPKLAVLNKTLMPAVIIEGGFLSNSSDLRVIITDEYIEKYAVATARGIINALNASID
ncbi:MAG: N-acetylmuramoyl-L-alanine amidase family protein [Eubacteriales bacterium]|nr:N-acetylmuramoyl-L-alanine amidase family protein [Eubacteriales bacterium]MDD3349785.1 N-acetylmuramoyl-L-alanine amidase family protein [Eubacteriales bacterium]